MTSRADRGAIFTFGESAAIGLIGSAYLGSMFDAFDCGGSGSCARTGKALEGIAISGAIAFAGFRIWEVADAVIAPAVRDRRVRRTSHGRDPAIAAWRSASRCGSSPARAR